MIPGRKPYSVFSSRVVPLVVALFIIAAGTRTSHAQEVTLQGTITAINGSMVTVGNVVVDVSRVDRDDDDISLAIGQSLQGSIIQINNIWVVQQIFIINNVVIGGSTPSPTATIPGTATPLETPTATPTATPSGTPSATMTPASTPAVAATPTPAALPLTGTPVMPPTGAPQPDDDDDPIIVIEGPIQAINANIITIFNINIVVNALNANVNVALGTWVRVEGVGCDDDDDCDMGGSASDIQIAANTLVNISVTTGGSAPPSQPGSGSGSPGVNPGGGSGGDDDDDDDDDDD